MNKKAREKFPDFAKQKKNWQTFSFLLLIL